MAAPRQMIERLQALRFLAAGLVLVGHIIMEAIQHQIDLGPMAPLVGKPWGIGVDIFFVISGFIISYSAHNLPATWTAAGDFLANRVIRVWPMYALFTALMLVPLLLLPGFLAHGQLSGAHVAASLTFVPWPRPDDGRMFPLLGQGWTLNYEMFFYVSFALSLLLPPRRRVIALCLGGTLLIIVGAMLPLPEPLGFYSRPIVGEFLFGILLNVLFRRVPAMPLMATAAIILAPVLLFFLLARCPDVPSLITMGPPAVLLVGGTLFLGASGERLLGRPLLVLLGNASYVLYLSHTFVVNAVLLIWTRLGLTSAPLFFLVAISSAVIFSVLVYKLIEQPSLKLLKRRYRNLREGHPKSVDPYTVPPVA